MPTPHNPANLRSGVHNGVGVRGGHDPPERLPGAVPGPGRDAGPQHSGQRDLPGLFRGVQDARRRGVQLQVRTYSFVLSVLSPLWACIWSHACDLCGLSRRSRYTVHSQTLASAVMCLTYPNLSYHTQERLQVRSRSDTPYPFLPT